MDVAIATCRPLPEPDPDAEPLARALERAGLVARALPWHDAAAPFEEARLVVIRSTWDYIHRLDGFLAWTERLGARLLNPPPVVRWNSHKRYLLELAREGLPIVPTELVPQGDAPDLAALLDARGWADAVVKPAVSAGSFLTSRVHRAALAQARPWWFAHLVAQRDALVQPYVPSVEGYGERALVVVDGEVTHAVRKSPRFHGESESVSATPQDIAADERAFALEAVALGERLAGAPLFYARVDVARDERGRPMLMELELIEPSLFFAKAPAALDRFVRGLARRLGR